MRKISLFLTVILISGCGGGGGGGSGGGTSASPGGVTGTKGKIPPGGKPTFVTGQAMVSVPKVGRPALHKPITDPVFGTTLTRITDPSMAAGTADKPVLG